MNMPREGAAHLPGDVLVDRGTPVEEHDDPDHGGGDEHLRVHAQPGEVEADLLPKVLPAPKEPETGCHSTATSCGSPARAARTGATCPLGRQPE